MEKMFVNLEKQLKTIEQSEQNVLRREERSVEICILALTELKSIILRNGFQSKISEIDFFKRIKPRFESRLKYHVAVFDLEKHKPLASTELQRTYFENKLKEIDAYIQANLDFYTYYKAGRNNLDEVYFLRPKCNIQLALQSCVFDIDIKFRTSHDHKVARILANELLLNYIQNALLTLDGKEPIAIAQVDTKSTLTWVESKAALIELIYALICSGAFGNTNLDIKEITACFEELLNIDLGDFYRTYHDIKARKSGRTKFLDNLKENLIRKMDLSDDFPTSQKVIF